MDKKELSLGEMQLLTNPKKIMINTDVDFKLEIEEIISLAKSIRIFSNARYGDSVYQSGSVGNYYSIKRKFDRLKMRFENGKKIMIHGDTLLDTYVDLLNYSIFGILIGMIEEEITLNMIDERVIKINNEIENERKKENENRS